MEREYTRIAVLFPAFGLVHGELCRIAAEYGAEAVIFRVPASENANVDPETFVGNPDASIAAVGVMGSLDMLRSVASETPTVRPDVVAWSCTSASFIGEEDTLTHQVEVLSQASGVPATTTSVAILHALRIRGVKRLCVLTPYVPELGEKFLPFLESHGFEVLSHGHAGGSNDEEIGMLTVDDFALLARQAWHPEAEAIVIPCTAVRVGRIVDQLEADYGVPVILANTATIEHAVRLAATG